MKLRISAPTGVYGLRRISVHPRTSAAKDDFVGPYFRKAQPDQVEAILKAREPARILIAIGKKKDNRWHLQLAQCWRIQYNFYVNYARWGRMFVRMCP